MENTFENHFVKCSEDLSLFVLNALLPTSSVLTTISTMANIRMRCRVLRALLLPLEDCERLDLLQSRVFALMQTRAKNFDFVSSLLPTDRRSVTEVSKTCAQLSVSLPFVEKILQDSILEDQIHLLDYELISRIRPLDPL